LRELKEEIIFLNEEYTKYKKRYNLMDYDDLLINLLRLLKENPKILAELNNQYKYVMVDEYQDSNKIQHEIALNLAGRDQNLMAVGDDAQSIYSFRGANFQNIMFFPESFSNCTIYKIEENYRSTSQILDLTNIMIKEALFKYEKQLTSIKNGEKPKIIEARNERMQSQFIVQQVLDHREEEIELQEMAVLFRSGFHSFDLEIELEKANIPFRKFGGLKFIETAHIKDIISYIRILSNPKDAISWQRSLMLLDGIGPRTSNKIINEISKDNLSIDDFKKLPDFGIKNEKVLEFFENLQKINNSKMSVGDKCALFTEYYRPILKNKYDDWQKR
jgi:DNA helicase-2/ATP-dependent DNA helicase PcrA